MRARDAGRLLPLLAWYLVALVALGSHPDDEASYVDLARRLTEGSYTSGGPSGLLDAAGGSPDLWYGPGLPALLAPLVALDIPLEWLRVVGPLTLFAGMLLLHRALRTRFDERTALLATYVVGLYPPFLPLLTNLHSETLAVAFLCLAMAGLGPALEAGRLWAGVAAATGLAGLALTRVAYGWVLTVVLVAAVAWWALGRSGAARRFVLVVAASLVLCLPWLAYTRAETGQMLVWGNSGPLSLYWMTSPFPGDRGDWRQADDVFTDPALAPHRPFFETLRGLDLARQNERLTEQALEQLRSDPGAYLGNLAANVGRLIVNAPYSDSRWEPNDLVYAVPGILLVVVSGATAVVLVRRRSGLPPETLPFALLATSGVGLHLVVAAYPRMLTVLVPLVGWLATLAVVQLRAQGATATAEPADPAGVTT